MILTALREATRAHHTRLETRLDLFRTVRSWSDYTALLSLFYGFYRPMEARLLHFTEWETVGLNYAERQKTPLLAADLRVLGHSSEAIAALPCCVALPDMQTFAQALGCAYVLEGATLGGQIVLKQFGARLGLTAENGGAFFAIYGAEVPARWAQFREGLTRFSAVFPSEETPILNAACATFASLEEWVCAERVRYETP
jgi:heme oxygenase